MSPYLNAEVASERQRELLADGAAYHRTRTDRKPKAPKAARRYGRSRRFSAFVKDLAAASL